MGPINTELGVQNNNMLIVLNMTDLAAPRNDSFRATLTSYIGKKLNSRNTNTFDEMFTFLLSSDHDCNINCKIVDPCLSNPCYHGSTCVSQRSARFTCTCSTGYAGTLCDEVTNGGLSCGFSEGFCGLSQDQDDDLEFHREFQSFKYSEVSISFQLEGTENYVS